MHLRIAFATPDLRAQEYTERGCLGRETAALGVSAHWAFANEHG